WRASDRIRVPGWKTTEGAQLLQSRRAHVRAGGTNPPPPLEPAATSSTIKRIPLPLLSACRRGGGGRGGGPRAERGKTRARHTIADSFEAAASPPTHPPPQGGRGRTVAHMNKNPPPPLR